MESIALIRKNLEAVGFLPGRIVEDFSFNSVRIPLVAFSSDRFDARTSCVAALPGGEGNALKKLDLLGPSVRFLCYPDRFEWWSDSLSRPYIREVISVAEADAFFDDHKEDFTPEALFRAKTRSRLDSEYQLHFVDAGLMPFIEKEIGRKLSSLISSLTDQILKKVAWDLKSNEGKPTDDQYRWLIRVATRLLAAKILKDKGVAKFENVDFEDPKKCVNLVGDHYGAQTITMSEEEMVAVTEAGRRVERVSSLVHVTTESLADLYETALVNKSTRHALGIHSTPSYIIDYIVGKAETALLSFPQEERLVFEPACGSAGFLAVSLRVLADNYSGSDRFSYLRKSISGIEIDEFAIETARLALAVADIPNHDGWDIKNANMFNCLYNYTNLHV